MLMMTEMQHQFKTEIFNNQSKHIKSLKQKKSIIIKKMNFMIKR